MLACTCTAISALARRPATCPSIPAVLRPVLRCVTCRTLTSVLLQLRSASFCRFLASGQSPACTALKIRPSRRTCSSWNRQSTRSQASPSNEGRPSVCSPKCPTCPSVPAFTLASSQRLTCPRQRPRGPEHQARVSLPPDGHLPGGDPALRHSPSCPAFRPPAFASWAPCPARGFRPSYDRPTDRPAPTRACRADPGEVSTFRTHETRTGLGALIPRGRRCSPARRTDPRPPPAASRRPVPSTPGQDPTPGCISDEASARVP